MDKNLVCFVHLNILQNETTNFRKIVYFTQFNDFCIVKIFLEVMLLASSKLYILSKFVYLVQIRIFKK